MCLYFIGFGIKMFFDSEKFKRFGVLVCEDLEKWGGIDYIGECFKFFFVC